MKQQITYSIKSLIVVLFFFSLSLHPSSCLHAEDCAKNSDACSAGTKKLSPFIEASMSGSSRAPVAQAGVKKREAAVKPAPAAAPEVPSAAPAVPSGQGGNISSPAWLLLVAGGIAMLSFYLRGGNKKRKKK